MISVGVDVNQAKNDDGSTPLHIACHKGHIEVVATLLAENADVNRVAFGGITPLYAACHNGHIEVVATLLAENADVNKADNDGDTPLYAACGNGRAEVVATLLAENADVNQAANDGTTPLYAACGGNGRAEVVTTLLAQNADVNQAANDGTTPLYVACENGDLGVVQLLSSYGASRIFTDTDDNLLEAPYDTAEHLAIEQGHHETAAWLVTSRHWSLLHYLEFITTERALELLRDGVGTDAAAPQPEGDPFQIVLVFERELIRREHNEPGPFALARGGYSGQELFLPLVRRALVHDQRIERRSSLESVGPLGQLIGWRENK